MPDTSRIAHFVNLQRIIAGLVDNVAPGITNACKRGLSTLLPYQPMPGGKERLDAEYANGVWNYLKSLDELCRFSVVAGYCQHLKPGGSILEIGCGEGLLQERLNVSKYSRYVGIDISSEAISLAAKRAQVNCSFVPADATTYMPGEEFDIIVFNECLEYFSDPLGLVNRYEQFLDNNGVFVVSMFVGLDTARTKRSWRMLQTTYTAMDVTRVSNGKNYTWVIKVLASKGKSTHIA